VSLTTFRFINFFIFFLLFIKCIFETLQIFDNLKDIDAIFSSKNNTAWVLIYTKYVYFFFIIILTKIYKIDWYELLRN
jgi:hypothetical protein